MKWVSIQAAAPPQSGQYYWKGKGCYGGIEYYNCEINEYTKEPYGFDFGVDIPTNKVDEENLFWLDESE